MRGARTIVPEVPVTLTPWFDAKDNPPKPESPVITNLGIPRQLVGFLSGVHKRWYSWCTNKPLYIEPTVWGELPSPPGTNDPLGPLTIADLRLAAALLAGRVLTTPEDLAAAAARLRRALDAIQKGEADAR